MMFDFKPKETPEGIPVITAFLLQDRAYVVDYYGTMYRILTHDPDPDYWVWTEVTHL